MLSEAQQLRYARQIILPQVGGSGQAKLKNARVLCVGAGGLGSPAALYLAAAGIGTLGIADDENVELSNLHRQILHFTTDVGRPKVSSAKQKLAALNPDITVNLHRLRLDEKTIGDVFHGYDLVLDGSDNFPTRYLVNDACIANGIPLVSGAVVRWEGNVLTILPGKSACYRCVFPEPPEPGCSQGCAEAGVMGPAAGTIGSLMATEAIKLLLAFSSPCKGEDVRRTGEDDPLAVENPHPNPLLFKERDKKQGELLADRLLTIDFLTMRFREVPVKRDSNCEACALGKFPALSANFPSGAETCAGVLK